jgi:RNA polymerase sigma factor (sigma-70 family)
MKVIHPASLPDSSTSDDSSQAAIYWTHLGVSPHELLVTQLPLIEELIRCVARRYRLSRADAEEFGSVVRLRLIDHNYAILRKFRGRSSLRTFLTVVVARLCLDYVAEQWGRWRPSAAARRLGAAAVQLETLVFRDGVPFDEACQRLMRGDAGLTPAHLRDLMDRLPPRYKRRFVDERSLDGMASPASPPDANLTLADARRRSRVLAASLASLDPEDRQLVTLRFVNDLTVAEIARRSGTDQAALYRRLERVLRHLRVDMGEHDGERRAG